MTGQLRPLVWALAFLGGGFLASIEIVGLILEDPLLTTPVESLLFAALQTAVLLGVFGLLTLLASRQLGLRITDFGLRPMGRGFRGFVWGLGLGAAVAVMALGLAALVSSGGWWIGDWSVWYWLQTVAVIGVVLFPAAFVEELAFRGVPLVVLSRSMGRWQALVFLGVLFGLAHLHNPGSTPLGVANICLAGVFLGQVFLNHGGLWACTGAHLGWNLALAGSGTQISGLPLPIPGLDYIPAGPVWLTGGSFGPEGGVLATVCLLAGCLVAGRRPTRTPPG